MEPQPTKVNVFFNNMIFHSNNHQEQRSKKQLGLNVFIAQQWSLNI
jgi:hypothetical protein